MKIAFYAPLKSPDHPVPSGDRLMARLLLQALRLAGHTVHVASDLRSFHATPETVLPDLELVAWEEIARLSALYAEEGPPDLWFCYHPYYKAPDLIGPELCKQFSVPYVTAEASYSKRRNLGVWAEFQAMLLANVETAALNLCLTGRDLAGLQAVAPDANYARLPPFIDATAFLAREPVPQPGVLAVVAMMRPGDKLMSYTALAKALTLLPDLDWQLQVVGDGPCRGEVEGLFSQFAAGRVTFLGEQSPDGVAEVLSRASLYVWPGHGEAYGLAYLEAQAAGLPVVAEAVAGVPEVVTPEVTGVLTPPGDAPAFAEAIRTLLTDSARREAMAVAARQMVREQRSLAAASARLSAQLGDFVKEDARETRHV
ncbi:glycosyltransferase family 4 protein [Allorhizobium taibaishanense]|uniref:Glycosyl transferase n=1 Tax=Allorhizobium taibaishanense TaxID=887144 RepID=A0A1Q9A5D8_9HYPH|nr:glycosyltransferase family 4 protein [Allorhizobium taibaishanense]MBB4006884.1 glycosyltransferase involved in cell wall biosynthesis [Allorhizobium taibaishanense]OLP49760.1 glycosyl transferase [Allorhizobium taibaishanense]